MAQASSNDPRNPAHEPFGQLGVGQYVIPALATASLVVMILSLAMWYRSHRIVDSFTSEKAGSSWIANSIYGRIFVVCRYRAERYESLDGAWNYDTQPMPQNLRDAWAPSVWKSIGIEFRNEVLPPTAASSAAGGWWLRVRWPFIAAMSSVLPIVRVLYVIRQRRELARMMRHACPECGYDLRASPKFCPECGRPVSAVT